MKSETMDPEMDLIDLKPFGKSGYWAQEELGRKGTMVATLELLPQGSTPEIRERFRHPACLFPEVTCIEGIPAELHDQETLTIRPKTGEKVNTQQKCATAREVKGK